MESIVLYPAPGRGHLVSTVELAKLILNQNPSLTINIIIMNPPINLGRATSPYVAAVSATIPSIKFHHLPTISVDPNSYPNRLAFLFDHYRLVNPHVRDLLRSLSRDFTIRSLIIDFFCFPALDIASELKIPTYHFFTSGVSCLAVFLNLPSLYETTSQNFNDLKATFLHLPDFPPISLSHMPEPTLFRHSPECLYFIECAAHLTKSAGIIVNTFESLEPKAVKLLSSSSTTEGFCFPVSPVPPVYCVGPVVNTTTDQISDNLLEYCMTWLDSQPSRSVVFLCFGSMGSFSKQQLQEVAFGLERSRQRFLWVVRNPPTSDKSPTDQSDLDLDSILPTGFLDRTRDRGLVVKSWAPQIAVLNHVSVGGFVTHCGWNSVLESVCAGIPMVAWPLYAEQKINEPLLVEELKLALPMNVSKQESEGLVSAAEVEKRVRELMDSEEGNSVRERVVRKRDEAMAALSRGGSSRVALAKLVQSCLRGN